MIFKVPKELSEQAVLACAKCGNRVPNDRLDDAQHGRLGPCPICGSEQLADNPNSAMTYSQAVEYPGIVGMIGAGELFKYVHATIYVPKINTEKKKKTHPLVELMEAAAER